MGVDSLPGGFIESKDEGVGVFGFLDGGEDDVRLLDAGEAVSRGQATSVGEDLLRGERCVALVAAMDGLGSLPRAGVRVDLIGEVLRAAVGVGVGPGGRAQQGEAEGVAEGVVAVLAVVEDGDARGAVAEIGPAERG